MVSIELDSLHDQRPALMSYQEAKYAASFVTTLITSLIYAQRVQALHAAGYFDGADGAALTGRAILILIGAIVVAGILGQIVLAIVLAIFGNELESREDERDRQIEMRAMHLAFTLLGIGFLGAMILLALGRAPFLVFHLITYAMVLAGLGADLYRIWLHRRGF
jgi:hypothetical protein